MSAPEPTGALRVRVPAPLAGLSKPARLGLGLVAFIVLIALVVVAKPRLLLMLHGGATVRAEFAKSLEMQAGVTDVKIAGARVGKVSGVHRTDRGTVEVSMKIDSKAKELLHGSPRALVRPVTLLGGRYYIDLVPGGSGRFDGTTIGLKRTSVPVELPEVLSALQPTSRAGLQAVVGELGQALENGGTTSLSALADHAPSALEPAGVVLRAVQGETPSRDLPQLVTGVNGLAATATRRDGQLETILADLATTAQSLDAVRRPLARTVDSLPSTLTTTRTGLAHLSTTLDALGRTADRIRPVAKALDSTLASARPVLAEARPVVADLRPLLADARPLVRALVPTASNAEGALSDLRGPVLDRVNGPVISTLNSKWKGSGVYDGNGNTGRTVYQEVGVLAARFNNLSKVFDQNGPFANLQLGVGTNTLGGTPADKLLLALTKIWGSPS